MHTPGPRFVQSVSAVQAPQVLVGEQTGFASAQSAPVRHSTHAPVADEHWGLAEDSMAHVRGAAASLQATQVPAVEQNGLVADAQSVSAPHSTQAPLVPQTGLVGSTPAQVEVLTASWLLQETQVFCAPQKGVAP
jgi:hypothetical protein